MTALAVTICIADTHREVFHKLVLAAARFMILTVIQRVVIADRYLAVSKIGLNVGHSAAKVCPELGGRGADLSIRDSDGHTTKGDGAILPLQVNRELSAGLLGVTGCIAALAIKSVFTNSNAVHLDAWLLGILVGKFGCGRGKGGLYLSGVAVLVCDLYLEVIVVILSVAGFFAALIGQLAVLIQADRTAFLKGYLNIFTCAGHGADIVLLLTVHGHSDCHRAAVRVRSKDKTVHMPADGRSCVRYGSQCQGFRRRNIVHDGHYQIGRRYVSCLILHCYGNFICYTHIIVRLLMFQTTCQCIGILYLSIGNGCDDQISLASGNGHTFCRKLCVTLFIELKARSANGDSCCLSIQCQFNLPGSRFLEGFRLTTTIIKARFVYCGALITDIGHSD